MARRSVARAVNRKQTEHSSSRKIIPLRRAIVEPLEVRQLLSGTWTQFTTSAPGPIGTMLLLSDGSVMAQINGAGSGVDWARLTPDATGSYLHGTWTRLAQMNNSRLFYSSQVLRDGRVFVAGGEYGTGGRTGEVYNPLTNAWTLLPSQSFGGFSDSISEILPNGDVLISPVGPSTSGGTVIFHAATNTWSAGPTLFRGGSADEDSWVKLPDNSILDLDNNGTSERYIPSLNRWVNDGSVPVSLFDSQHELGAAFLLPSGKVIALGGTSHTAIYTPSGTNSPGTWVAGPDMPNQLGAPDTPAAMLPDGTILCALGPANTLNGPTSFYSYDPVANAFSPVSGAPSLSDAPFVERMLDLPDGTVLVADAGTRPYVYNPRSAPLPIAQPVITSLTANGDGTFQISGTNLNGISEGASYGDDAQMNSNYPLVRFTSQLLGAVSFARAFNWSSTGVMTGDTPETAQFVPPLGIVAGDYSVSVIANGVASDPVTLTIPNGNAVAPTVATDAAASPSPATGTTTNLSVLGDDAGDGESSLTYTWQTLSVPGGSPLPSFSINGSNAAKNTVARFYRAGSYTFGVTITDSGGLSTTSTVGLTVKQTESSVTVSPNKATVRGNTTQQFTAQALDQFGQPMASQPRFTWTVSSGAGRISAQGLYSAPSTGTLATVTADDGTFQGTATVGVVPSPWSSQDVGGVGVTGIAYGTDTGFTVSGSGNTIGGTGDEFRFLFQTLSGNMMITARVAGEQGATSSSLVGVMMRNSLASNDQFVLMDLSGSRSTSFIYRTTKGAKAVTGNSSSGTAPYWVRLIRSGSTCTAYQSSNGSTWFREGSITIAMGTSIDVGLAVCSKNNTQLNTSTFQSVTLNRQFSNVISGNTANDAITLAADTDPQYVDWTIDGFSGKTLVDDPNGLTINGNGGVDTITLDYTNGNPLPNLLKLNSSGTFVVIGLGALAAGQTIDIGTSTVQFNYTDTSLLPSVQSLLKSGYNSGSWDGPGIISSAAAASGGAMMVADVDTGSAVVLNYRLTDDATGDGQVNFADLVALAASYNTPSGADWAHGDFNYDGAVNFADLVSLAANYGRTLAPMATASVKRPIRLQRTLSIPPAA